MKISIKLKLLVPLFLSGLLMTVGILSITRYFAVQAYKTNTKNLIHSKVTTLKSTLDNLGTEALYMSSIFSRMEIVKKAYTEYYRTGNLDSCSLIIEKELVPISKNIELATGLSPQIHFHLPPGKSFIRVWTKKRGDDISSFRSMVVEISKEHKPIKGVETGRAGYVVRGMSPIFSDDNEYLGSVEVFFGIEKLVKTIVTTNNQDFEVLLSNRLLKISTNFLAENSTNIKSC